MIAREKTRSVPQILLVEDELEMRNLLKLMVSEWGYTPLEAESVKDALSGLSRWHIDLMLLDLILGGANGMDLLKVLHRRKWKVPTLVVSAHVSAEIAQELSTLGVQGIVAKPFSKERLAAEIQRVLRR